MVEAYTSRPRSLERLQLIRLKAAFVHKKSPPVIDMRGGNGYNISRVRPKRSASCSGYSKDDNRPVPAGRLFLSDRYGYRFYVTLQRNKKHDNQFNHTSHPLSDGVLTAACPMYYTCKYYNAYV